MKDSGVERETEGQRERKNYVEIEKERGKAVEGSNNFFK